MNTDIEVYKEHTIVEMDNRRGPNSGNLGYGVVRADGPAVLGNFSARGLPDAEAARAKIDSILDTPQAWRP